MNSIRFSRPVSPHSAHFTDTLPLSSLKLLLSPVASRQLVRSLFLLVSSKPSKEDLDNKNGGTLPIRHGRR